jgi:hypothetical protein
MYCLLQNIQSYKPHNFTVEAYMLYRYTKKSVNNFITDKTADIVASMPL